MITNMSINTFRFILSSLFFVARKCKGFSGVVICLCGFEIFGFVCFLVNESEIGFSLDLLNSFLFNYSTYSNGVG